MKISILSVFPELYDRFLDTSLLKRAREAGLVSFDLESFFSYTKPGENIDAPTFGHGAGMLIKPQVVQKAVEEKEKLHGKAYKIFFSPHGKKLDQNLLKKMVARAQKSGHLMLLPARYEGMDARVEEHYADEIVSVGDFVLMGGDIPAMILLEGLLRLIPGIVGSQESVERDSFTTAFVDHPEYTQPVVWQGKEVPSVVRSGNHAAMNQWRLQQAVQRSVVNHFDWVRSATLQEEEKKMVWQVMPNHYVALMHDQVLIGPEKKEGTTSVTSIDIHDIARSAKTFGFEQYFIVTPLVDQKKIVKKLLGFWQEGIGVEYNPKRHKALRSVQLLDSLDDVLAAIEKKEGKRPIIITTSAKPSQEKSITFYDQAKVWSLDRPVLLLFGTGQGMAETLMKKSDFTLVPIEGISDFNHLSVRSAVAIVMDRWIGLNRRKADLSLAEQ